jgi:hypothetical protein
LLGAVFTPRNTLLDALAEIGRRRNSELGTEREYVYKYYLEASMKYMTREAMERMNTRQT